LVNDNIYYKNQSAANEITVFATHNSTTAAA